MQEYWAMAVDVDNSSDRFLWRTYTGVVVPREKETFLVDGDRRCDIAYVGHYSDEISGTVVSLIVLGANRSTFEALLESEYWSDARPTFMPE